MSKREIDIKIITKNGNDLTGIPFRSCERIWIQLFIKFDNEDKAKEFGLNIHDSDDKIKILHNLLNDFYKQEK
ncbi:hypothetical protein ES705_07242 [subsurface metagenome]